MKPSIAIVTALPEELEPLLRRIRLDRIEKIGPRRCYVGTLDGKPVVLLSGGDGVENARAAARALLDRFDVSLLIGAGIGGALSDDLAEGEVVAASEICSPNSPSLPSDSLLLERLPLRRAVIVTAHSIVRTRDARRALAQSTRASVVDTESFAWAGVAAERNVPFVILRVILDPASEELPAFIATSDTIDRNSIVRHAIFHPGVIPSLLRMRSRVAACSSRLSGAVISLVAASVIESSNFRLEELLAKTSRTFALCIPLLPEPSRAQVTIAYLLFRIADTFEDASGWTVPERAEALAEFCGLLRSLDPGEARRLAARWVAQCPSPHAGYLELLSEAPRVIEALNTLTAAAREAIVTHVIRSAEGMSGYVRMTAADGLFELGHLDDLRRYCYTVAGIVGEMLTELFIIGAPEAARSALFLRSRSAAFGEALQLVNILKDAGADLKEGRIFIPSTASREEVFEIARTDLDSATEYTLALQQAGAPRGMIAFVALPVALARATLDRVEDLGSGARLSRPEVFRIMRQLDRALSRNEPALTTPLGKPPAGTWKRSLLAMFSGNGNG